MLRGPFFQPWGSLTSLKSQIPPSLKSLSEDLCSVFLSPEESIDLVVDLLIDKLIFQMTYWLTDALNEFLIHWLSYQLSDSLTYQPTDSSMKCGGKYYLSKKIYLHCFWAVCIAVDYIWWHMVTNLNFRRRSAWTVCIAVDYIW